MRIRQDVQSLNHFMIHQVDFCFSGLSASNCQQDIFREDVRYQLLPSIRLLWETHFFFFLICNPLTAHTGGVLLLRSPLSTAAKSHKM